MSNRFLGAGEETKYHLLAGFVALDDGDGGSGARGGVGFSAMPLLERVRAAVYAASAFFFGGQTTADITPDRPLAEITER